MNATACFDPIARPNAIRSFASSINDLIALRILQGLGAASGSVLGRALTRDADIADDLVIYRTCEAPGPLLQYSANRFPVALNARPEVEVPQGACSLMWPSMADSRITACPLGELPAT